MNKTEPKLKPPCLEALQAMAATLTSAAELILRHSGPRREGMKPHLPVLHKRWESIIAHRDRLLDGTPVTIDALRTIADQIICIGTELHGYQFDYDGIGEAQGALIRMVQHGMQFYIADPPRLKARRKLAGGIEPLRVNSEEDGE